MIGSEIPGMGLKLRDAKPLIAQQVCRKLGKRTLVGTYAEACGKRPQATRECGARMLKNWKLLGKW